MQEKLLFFTTEINDSSHRLLEAVKKVAPNGWIEMCRDYVKLANCLKRNKVNSLVILANNKNELSTLLTMHKLFKNELILLVLPDESETTFTLGKQLDPSYTTIINNDFTGVTIFLKKKIGSGCKSKGGSVLHNS